MMAVERLASRPLARAPFEVRLLLLAVIALASGCVAAVLVLRSAHEPNPAAAAVFILLIGWSFVASGLVAWLHRPDNRVGKLLVAVGFVSFLSALAEANSSLPFTLGVVLGSASIAVLAHLLLAFPSGRLQTRLERALALGFYVDLVGLQLLWVLFADLSVTGCEDCVAGGIHEPARVAENAFLVRPSDDLADGIEAFQNAVGIVLVLSLVTVLVRRWRTSSHAARRALVPVLVAGLATAGLLLLVLGTYLVREDAAPSLRWVTLAAYASVPFAFLSGLMRTRLARAGVGRLLTQVPEEPTLEEAQEGLRAVLGDPTLRLACWLPESLRFVDTEGRPFEVPADSLTAVTTMIQYEDHPVAAVVHDPSLRDEPELLEEVLAAARLGLEKDRSNQALRRSEARNRALLNALPDLMFRIGRDGTYLDFNADRESELATPPEEILGKTVWERLPAEVAERLMRCADHALDEGGVQTVEYELDFPDGHRHYEGRLVASGPDEVVLIVRNITDRKRQEAEVRRLYAELERRLQQLQASRARIVEVGDAERRRLERNLHDGAQQRLVSLSLTLRLAEGRLESDPEAARRMLGEAGEELAQALAELRELARGIHPAVLIERGLATALESLVTRATVAVEVEELPGERLPPSVEAAVYYIVAEALTNAGRYARAEGASVRVRCENGHAVVRVADDGVGGADPGAGSGLRGLRDRVEALDGRFSVVSPPGEGTTITAEIPCA